MSSSTLLASADCPTTVWRDALGPGFTVAASERVVQVTASAAQKPYNCHR